MVGRECKPDGPHLNSVIQWSQFSYGQHLSLPQMAAALIMACHRNRAGGQYLAQVPFNRILVRAFTMMNVNLYF